MRALKMARLRVLSARRRVSGLGPDGRSMLFRPLRIDRRGVVGKEWTEAPGLAPTPAAGRIGLPIWPPSGLAPPPHLASEGTRAMGRQQPLALTGLAKRAQRERCRALVLIDTRKHRSARPRAFRWAPKPTRTGGAGKARVAFSDIKASRRRKRPSLPRWPRRRIYQSLPRWPRRHTQRHTLRHPGSWANG